MSAQKGRQAVWLVDLENTGNRWAHASHLFQPGDLVAMFWSGKSCTPDVKAMSAPAGAKYMFVECQNGTPNAMDFQIAAWLGMAAMSNPDRDFVILSADHGYQPLEKFMRKFDVSVITLDPGAALEIGPVQPQPDGPERPAAKDQAAEKPYGPVRSLYIGKLRDAGMNQDDLLRVVSAVLMQSMRLPQNMRKLDTRNRLTNRYGAKEGNALYNKIKSAVHDIAQNGPWPEPETIPVTVGDVNTALGKAGIVLHTGVAQKCLGAIRSAAACNPGDARKDSLRKAMSSIFGSRNRDKAYEALAQYLPEK